MLVRPEMGEGVSVGMGRPRLCGPSKEGVWGILMGGDEIARAESLAHRDGYSG